MEAEMMPGAWKRSGLAWASGVGTMLIAVSIRDGGAGAIDAWMIMGAAGMAALFAKSVHG